MTRFGLALLAVVLAAGCALSAAPFVLDWQPRGAAWSTATRCDVTVGAVLAAAAFCGLLAALAGCVQDLYTRR